MRNFEAHTDKIRQDMLNEIGVKSADDFFTSIPFECKMKELGLDEALSEIQAQKTVSKISKKNKTDYISFIGGGAKKKYIPSAISDVSGRFEFLSAYTPYQSEISQGTLQIMYEFQTMMCELTGMDVSNASVYDGGTACAEACLMAVRISKKRRVFISNKLNPNYIEVIKTYLWAQDIDFVIGDEPPDFDFGGEIYSYPEYNGELKKIKEKRGEELVIACVDLSVLPCVEPPEADIITGDYGCFGLPLNFGGAYGGFICTKDKYKRQLTGRIAGKTVDREGKTAYVLTLQAREQHIRRNKATGNICSNQALTALCCNLYLSLTGKNSLIEIGNYSCNLAHELSHELSALGYKTLNKNFFDTFTVIMKDGITGDEFLDTLYKNGILGGIKLDDDKVIITTTEVNDREDIGLYINSLK